MMVMEKTIISDTTKKTIIGFVESHSYFKFENKKSDNKTLCFVTKKHGYLVEKKYHCRDLSEGYALEMRLKGIFSKRVNVEISILDEWVMVNVTINY